jgi:folate-binding protein YgfZ
MEQIKDYLWKGKPGCLLRVTGEDAFGYLQTQFTNKVLSEPGSFTYGLWLNRKGKVRADSFIFCSGSEEFYVLSYYIEAGVLKPIIEENIVADDVEIEDLTSDFLIYSFFGMNSSAFSFKEGQFSGSFPDKVYFFGKRGQDYNYDLLIHNSKKHAPLLNEVENKISYIDEPGEFLEKARIISSIPRVGLDITEDHLPQEGGLEKRAVHFNKGCYLGQEVMARIHAQGRVNRGLFFITIQCENINLPATIISKETSKVLGSLTSYYREGDSINGLAILKKSGLSKGIEVEGRTDMVVDFVLVS